MSAQYGALLANMVAVMMYRGSLTGVRNKSHPSTPSANTREVYAPTHRVEHY